MTSPVSCTSNVLLQLLFLQIVRIATSHVPAATVIVEEPDINFRSHDVIHINTYSTVTGNRLLNTSIAAGGHESSINMDFTAFNRSYHLRLQLNRRMFGTSYVEKYHTGSRMVSTTKQSQQLMEDHCYYTGSVDADELSSVAVSTCHEGIVGYIVTSTDSYHIQPQSASTTAAAAGITGLHYVYRQSDSLLPPMNCGVKHDESTLHHQHFAESMFNKRKRKRSFNWPQDLDGTTKLVELYIVNDYTQYQARGSDLNAVVQRTKDIVNIVNSLYESQNVYFVLVGIETWTARNLITINQNNVSGALDNFQQYRTSSINPSHSNDNAQLITNVAFSGGVVGLAAVGTMCTYFHSAGINSDLNPRVNFVGTSMAHEIGHNFGLLHDSNVPGCQCPDTGAGSNTNCIMFPTAGGAMTATRWSSCSVDSFNFAFTHGLDVCLKNAPTALYDTSTYCGNGIIEAGEQCDCGSSPIIQECNAQCCNATTCQLIGSAQCAAGRCCDVARCQLLSKGATCRPATGQCDLSEYCSGTDASCPADAHKVDTTDCSVNGVAAYCYDGQCRTHQSQCQLLWGAASMPSDNVCFSNYNTVGNSYGNCGFNLATRAFSSCSATDVMCGRLMCNLFENLTSFASTMMYGKYWSSLRIGRQIYSCGAVIIDVGMQLQDPGLVPNGAACGNGQMCYNQRCRDVSVLVNELIPRCPNNCSGNGVCTSLGQCLCNQGYETSDCSSPSTAQMVDSTTAEYRPPYSSERAPPETSQNTALIVGLCILFLVILPLLVLAAICGYQHRQSISACYLRLRRHRRSNVGRSEQPRRRAVDMNLAVITDVSAATSKASKNYEYSTASPDQHVISTTQPSRPAPLPPDRRPAQPKRPLEPTAPSSEPNRVPAASADSYNTNNAQRPRPPPKTNAARLPPTLPTNNTRPKPVPPAKPNY